MAIKGSDTAQRTKQYLVRLCESASALGVYEVIPKHARVLSRLADHGFFKAGGILVGTHAYLAYQNRLGVRWSMGAQTVDLDFAHADRNISIALNPDFPINTHAAIDSLKMGFLPVNERTRYVKEDEPDFDLDFLTGFHRKNDQPIRLEGLGISLQPMRFMEFSMESPVVSVLPSASGPIVVNIPSPARYAVSKLLLHPLRLEGSQPEKAKKDLLQAGSLVDVLSNQNPDSLQEAWDDLISRDPKWKECALSGLKSLSALLPQKNWRSLLGAEYSWTDSELNGEDDTRPQSANG
jgi:hypothetical protein